MKTVAIDFDGTIAHYDGWKGVDNIGEPVTGIREVLLGLKEAGYKIVIHTCRITPEVNGDQVVDAANAIRKWMSAHDLPYDSIWQGVGKPVACAYIDDRAIGVPRNGFAETGTLGLLLDILESFD